MLLKRLKLYNFRQFYGSCEIDFSTDKERNITLIHGENGVGKTTLLNSILWCLFGKLTDDFEGQLELVSNQATKEGITSCHVEIHLASDGKEYRLIRKFHKGKKLSDNDFVVYQVDDGINGAAIDNPKSLINRILPSDMAEYFFFHGEGASKLNSATKGAGFRRAIRDILGFTFAEKAIEDLNYVIRKKEQELKKIASLSKEAEIAINKKHEIENYQKVLEEKVATLRDKSSVLKIQKEEFDDKLRKSNHVLVREKKKKIELLDRERNNYASDLSKIKAKKRGLIQRYGWIVFSNNLTDKSNKLLKDQEDKLKGRIPATYEEVFVNDLLESQLCICGRPLEVGSEEYKTVESTREAANNDIINDKLLKARTFSEHVKISSKQFLLNIDELEKEISLLEKRIGVNEESTKELISELSNFDDDRNVRLWQESSSVLKKQILDASNNIAVSKSEIQRMIVLAKDFDKKIYTDKSKLPQLHSLNNYKKMIQEMIQRCEDKLDEYESSSKAIIAAQVNEILTKFSRKDYQVKLTENYEFFLVREDGKKVAKSKGENLLLNLSFISALIKHAADRESASGKFLISGTTAPFVIDAPFGELDETYKGATASFLPENSNQLILFLSSSHWNGTVDNAIKHKVGSEYLLVSHRISAQDDKPVDAIEISGKSFLQSRYSQAHDKTTILKVSA